MEAKLNGTIKLFEEQINNIKEKVTEIHPNKLTFKPDDFSEKVEGLSSVKNRGKSRHVSSVSLKKVTTKERAVDSQKATLEEKESFVLDEQEKNDNREEKNRCYAC